MDERIAQKKKAGRKHWKLQISLQCNHQPANTGARGVAPWGRGLAVQIGRSEFKLPLPSRCWVQPCMCLYHSALVGKDRRIATRLSPDSIKTPFQVGEWGISCPPLASVYRACTPAHKHECTHTDTHKKTLKILRKEKWVLSHCHCCAPQKKK